MLRKIYQIILIALAVKIAYVLFAIAFQEYTPQKVDPGDAQSVLDVFKRHDSYWYEKIATFGHEKITPDQLGKCDGTVIEQSYYAFFPLYPTLIGLSMSLTGAGFNTTALFYSLVFSLSAFILFFIFAGMYLKDERKAFMATLILILFPFHYYFSMYYTESLYLLLLLAGFIAAHRNQHVLLAVLLGFLVLVRPNALLMAIPLFIYYFEKHFSLNVREIFRRNRKEYLPLLAFAAAPAVMLLYCVYLEVMTGDFFAFQTAQQGWCNYTTWPWTPLLRMQSWQEYFKFGYLAAFGLVSIVLWRRIPLSMHALIWINLLLPLTSNMITLPRFISCIFIFPLLSGDWTAGWKWPLRLALALVLFAGQLLTFTYWLSSSEFAY